MMYYFAWIPLLINSFLASIDSNGWASVEHPKRSASSIETLHEEDPTLWVVFAKQIGAEKFLVCFPEDPCYTYVTADEMEVASGDHLLRISRPQPLEEREEQLRSNPDILLIETNQPAPNVLDLFYQKHDQWVWERLVLSPQHLYFLQTTSDQIFTEPHQKFIDSLDVEPAPIA